MIIGIVMDIFAVFLSHIFLNYSAQWVFILVKSKQSLHFEGHVVFFLYLSGSCTGE